MSTENMKLPERLRADSQAWAINPALTAQNTSSLEWEAAQEIETLTAERDALRALLTGPKPHPTEV